VPAGLTTASWQDWDAVVHLGMRHLRARVGPEVPLTVVGYSNGGALAVKYALAAIDDQALPRADRLVLISPMIGVSPLAGLARLVGALGVVPYFEKTKWLDVLPEYNPFKFNSFPTHAAVQTAVLTRALQQQVDRLAADGRIARMPPALTFQSLVDATVDAQSVVTRFYDKLPRNGSELVVFDINRLARLDAFMRPSDRELLNRLMQRRERNFRLTVMTNLDHASLTIVARSGEPGSSTVTETPTPPTTTMMSAARPNRAFLARVVPRASDVSVIWNAPSERQAGPEDSRSIRATDHSGENVAWTLLSAAPPTPAFSLRDTNKTDSTTPASGRPWARRAPPAHRAG